MHSDADKNFRFRYTVFTVTAQMETEHLHVQMGIKQIDLRFDRLQHLFVDDRKSRESVELILSYLSKNGKLKRARIFSDHGESGLAAFVQALLEIRPEIDIRHLSVDEAYERMGSHSLTWYALPALMTIALLLVTLMCTPLLLHGLDTERTDLKIADIGHPPKTRTLRIIGGHLKPTLSINDARSGDPGDRTTMWIPLVAEEWQVGDDIEVVVQILASDLEGVMAVDFIDGLLRDVWWEGLRDTRRKQLVDAGARLSAGVWLVDARGSPRDDLGLALLILITLGVIVGGVTLILFVQHRGRQST